MPIIENTRDRLNAVTEAYSITLMHDLRALIINLVGCANITINGETIFIGDDDEITVKPKVIGNKIMVLVTTPDFTTGTHVTLKGDISHPTLTGTSIGAITSHLPQYTHVPTSDEFLAIIKRKILTEVVEAVAKHLPQLMPTPRKSISKFVQNMRDLIGSHLPDGTIPIQSLIEVNGGKAIRSIQRFSKRIWDRVDTNVVVTILSIIGYFILAIAFVTLMALVALKIMEPGPPAYLSEIELLNEVYYKDLTLSGHEFRVTGLVNAEKDLEDSRCQITTMRGNPPVTLTIGLPLCKELVHAKELDNLLPSIKTMHPEKSVKIIRPFSGSLLGNVGRESAPPYHLSAHDE